jgi:cytidylate kinase
MTLKTNTRSFTPVPQRGPQALDTDNLKLPSLQQRHDTVPWPMLPQEMLIAIDGFPGTPCNLVGKHVATALGALFINTEHLYTALVNECLSEGLDLNDVVEVRNWCVTAALDVRFARRNSLLTAEFAVNGEPRTALELENRRWLAEEVNIFANFRPLFQQALVGCDFHDRVVMAGRNIGPSLFWDTPYKFFLDKPDGSVEPEVVAACGYPNAGKENFYTQGPTLFCQRTNALMIDSTQTNPGDLVLIVLVESVARASEMGFLDGPFEKHFEVACELGKAIRMRVNAERQS